MNLQCKVVENLPPLVWLAECTKKDITVVCGNRVEKGNDFFVEGAWSGVFTDFDFVSSDWFCGTGAKVCENYVVFSTPSHVTSALYYFERNAGGGY